MWSNFFARAEQSRARAARPKRKQMSEGRETALKLGLLLAGLGLVLMVTAAGTDHWGQLATRARPGNVTCRASHFGLWRQCLKIILQTELEDEEGICGPVDLPGVSNCSYFQFFTTGQPTLIMDRHAEKELFIVAAVLAIICMCLIILGLISIGTALNRNTQFLLKLSATFFISAGLAGVATLLSFDRAALGVLRAAGETALELTLRWSFGCGIASTLFTSLAGLTFLLLSLPPLSPCRAKAGGA